MIAAALSAVTQLVCGAAVTWHCDSAGTTQRIYYGNHSSHLDFMLIWSSLPPRLRRSARPVAGRDYWERGAARRYLASRVFQAVLIERGGQEKDPTSARFAIEQMARAMGDRYSLIVFPEGTRSADGLVGPFKSGLYHLSVLRPDVELVPVYLENLNRILPKGELLPVPMMSRVTFGSAFSRRGILEKAEFLLNAREALMQLRDSR